MPMWPTVCAAPTVKGHTLEFRNALPDDAEFILSLRLDAGKNQYLSGVSPEVEKQRAWLENYQTQTGQAYFIICSNGRNIGTVRLYDGQEDSFCWGSWILTDDRPRSAAVESAAMVYAYGIDHLGFSRSHFDVRKGNDRVHSFHTRWGAQVIKETDLDIFYTIPPAQIENNRTVMKRFLPNGIIIE